MTERPASKRQAGAGTIVAIPPPSQSDAASWRVVSIRASAVGIATIIEAPASAFAHMDSPAPDMLARTLRLVGDCVEQLGSRLPAMGIVTLPRDSDETQMESAREIVARWAADQDWNRGDFALAFAKDREGAENLVRERLGPADESAYRLRGTLDAAAFRDNVAEELKAARGLKSARRDLVSAALQGLDATREEPGPGVLSGAVERWAIKVEERFDEATASDPARGGDS